MRKFMRSNFSAFILAFALIVCTCIPAFATTSLQYVERSVDANGNVVSTTKTANCTQMLSSTTVWEDSKWYYPYARTTEITSVTVSGDVHLILSKGHTLTVKKGIYVKDGSSLTIYGQPSGDGTLVTTGEGGYAGIGGFNGAAHNAPIAITIHGGNITATGGTGAAGIGGCFGGNSITIYGGTITATGGDNAAGIGGNISTLNTTITIYGGEITATGGQNGAGIGDGLHKIFKGGGNPPSTINIYGGNITATGGKYKYIDNLTHPPSPEDYAAGIGGGINFTKCTVNIYGGNITASSYGGENSYGIRDGYGIRGQVTLSYKNANDSIYATNYGGSVTLADGKPFIVSGDGTEISGTVEVVKVEKQLTQTEVAIVDTCPALDGKTLIPPSYNVSIGTTGLIASTAKAFPGETVTVSPAEGYNLTAVYVDGSAITGTTFAMPAKDVTVTGTLTPITYTITYELDGGTVAQANPTTYNVETETFTLNKPTKTGYTFTGWSSFVGGTHPMNMTIKKGSTGNKTCIANWTINQYTLTFDTQGGSEVSAITQDYDTAIIAPTDPVKENYKFNGWDKTIPAKMPAENMTFTARWTAESYTINYELNGGTVTSNPTSYTIESEAMTLNNPTKAGYTFKGWTGTDITGTVETVTIAKGSTGNRTYTAVFEKNLSHWGKTDSYVPDGSESNPYVISTLDGWNLLADELTNGNDYSGQFFRLSNDLTVTTMLGTSETGFAVTFEGNGKTLTFNYEGADDYCAPFCYVDGGTIKDLTVTGTIKTSGQHIGGIIGQSSGNTAIEACNFVGKLLTTNTDITIGGGFVAENNGTLTISNSLYAPATIEDGETEPSAEGSATFARDTEGHTSTITNSYYTRKLGTEQGKQGYTVTAETGITVALAEGSTNGLSFDG